MQPAGAFGVWGGVESQVCSEHGHSVCVRDVAYQACSRHGRVVCVEVW